jgi:hypothetical protein
MRDRIILSHKKEKGKRAQPVTSRTALSSVKKMMITTTSNDDFIVSLVLVSHASCASRVQTQHAR